MIKLFKYLNYFIYQFYQGRDNDPWIYSSNGSVLLVFMNIVSVLIIIGYNCSINISDKVYPYYLVGFGLVICFVLNYLLIYKGNKEFDIFESIKQTDNNLKRVVCLLYIIFSIISFVGIAFYIKNRKFS